MKTKPIVPWMGGKRRLVSQLIEKMPEHQCYVELFAGGAALFFMRDQPSRVEVINDLNGELVNLYRVVQHHLEEFVRQFKWALVSRQMFEWLKSASVDLMTDIQRAARFYYLQHTAFGAKVSGQNFGTATTARPVNLLRIEEQLSEAHLRLSGVTVEHLSWDACLLKYDRPHSFMYADPPYWKLAGYGVDFELDQYQKMAELMKTCKSKVMLSINDHEDMRAVFDGLNIAMTKIKYSVGNSGTGRDQKQELIITNY
ncbi:DNA adenine methylase [Acinetobacter baumannii]|uniref:DNA adenine methylase n=1 Tax=Acinetobacter baumannii TaxID=470 RepID=UPI0001F8AE1F|nr:DNA adenine methylase [Acinetobacter baumannii]ADX03014.1 prophage PSPPH02, putative adenine modification methytransferase [Acinetobacter baumannii 1656-2]AOP63344.1 DNA adenine methylase family protein [Acinetobacter baumannii DU202]RQL51996.1 restriction endonuclease subunit M [Acinetobacter baumannii]RSP41892.1 DNA adenine methylase [Acinetobacter baumannii]